jgi:hypothetical protein
VIRIARAREKRKRLQNVEEQDMWLYDIYMFSMFVPPVT